MKIPIDTQTRAVEVKEYEKIVAKSVMGIMLDMEPPIQILGTNYAVRKFP